MKNTTDILLQAREEFDLELNKTRYENMIQNQNKEPSTNVGRANNKSFQNV
jgi:hypothetical protein